MNYNEILRDIERGVLREKDDFESLTSMQKISHIGKNIKGYLDNQKTANYHKSHELNSDKHKTARVIAEGLEQRAGIRVKNFTSWLSDEEQNMFADMLESKLNMAKMEKDFKKADSKYQFVNAGCVLCRLQNSEAALKVEGIKSMCQELYFEAML